LRGLQEGKGEAGIDDTGRQITSPVRTDVIFRRRKNQRAVFEEEGADNAQPPRSGLRVMRGKISSIKKGGRILRGGGREGRQKARMFAKGIGQNPVGKIGFAGTYRFKRKHSKTSLDRDTAFQEKRKILKKTTT